MLVREQKPPNLTEALKRGITFSYIREVAKRFFVDIGYFPEIIATENFYSLRQVIVRRY